MISDRVVAGLDRARSSGKRLGRPRTAPFKIDRIRSALDEGRGVRETARLLKESAAIRDQAHFGGHLIVICRCVVARNAR